ncbi:MAG: type II toxin-antitoxin system VapC family toxin [Anaerolineae bacterium]
MRFLLDTDICIYLIRHKPAGLLRKLTAQPIGDVGVSSITVAELQYGVQRSSRPEQNAEALTLFLLPLVVADFDYRAAEAYGRIRARLESNGTPIGPLDTLIAAHAASLNATLITNNVAEFSRVPELRIENWL